MSSEDQGIKRPFDGNSDSQPEPKKMALSNTNDGNRQPMTNGLQNGNANPGPPQTSELFYVPDKMVGLLIGKGGEQISIIQGETGCRVQFSPESGSSQRQCTLTGQPAGIARAKKMIEEIIERNQALASAAATGGGSIAPSNSDEMSIEMNIPGGKVGLIIGKAGDTIKQLQEKAGVRIAIIQDSNQPTTFDKPLKIVGTKYNCQKAREMIIELMAAKDNFPPGFRQGGGGGPGSKANLQFPIPRSTVGVVIGKNGEMIKKIQDESGARVQFRPDDLDAPSPDRFCHIYGTREQNENAIAMIRELVDNSLARQNGGRNNFVGGGGGERGGGGWDHGRGNNNIEFSDGMLHGIPSDKVGIIIGKGGETIKEINRMSGAHAELIREDNNNPHEKRFRIKGNPDQVQQCVRMMHEKAGLPLPMENQFPINMNMGPPMGLPMGPPMGPPQMQVGAYQSPVMQGMIPMQGMVPHPQQFQQPQIQQQVMMAPQPAQTIYTPQPQQWPQPTFQGTTTIYAQPQPAAIAPVDPNKVVSDPNAAAWATYYAQAHAYPQPGQQVVQQAAPAPVQLGYTTQVVAATPIAATPAQPQPTINPTTGQPDYSLAWADYYRQQGMHQHAAAILAGTPLPQ